MPLPPRLISALCLVVISMWSQLATAEIEWTCRPGFEGWVKPGCWAPVEILLTQTTDGNQQGEDFIGTIDVGVSETLGDRGMRVSVPIRLPANGRQRVNLIAKFPFPQRSAELRLLRAGATEPVRTMLISDTTTGLRTSDQPGEPLIVVVEPDNATTTTIPDFYISKRRSHVARIEPSRMPDSWLGWEAADVVVLTSLLPGVIAPEAEQALAEWVERGGRLLVLGGADVGPSAAGSPIANILPVDVLGIKDTELARGDRTHESVPITLVKPRGNARALGSLPVAEGQSPLPLTYVGKHGLGEVQFWTHSSRGTRGLNALIRAEVIGWERLFRANGPDLLRATWAERFRPMLYRSRVLEHAAEPPKIAIILVLIVIYFLTVGPLNFRWLRNRRRLEWAWFTIPAIVLVFSVGMYLVGILTMGNEHLRRDVSLVVAPALGGRASVSTYSCFFAARTSSLTGKEDDTAVGFEFANLNPRPSLWSQTARTDGLFAMQESHMSPLTGSSPVMPDSFVLNRGADGRARLDEQVLAQWTWNLVASQGWMDAGQGISGTATHEGSRITGTLTNNTPWTIERPFLVTAFDDQFIRSSSSVSGTDVGLFFLGNTWAPGGSLNIGESEPTILSGNAATRGGGALALPGRLSKAAQDVFANLLTQVDGFPVGRLWLFGTISTTDHPSLIAGASSSREGAALVAIELPMKPGAGIEMPASQITATPVGWDGQDQPERVTNRSNDLFESYAVGDATVVFALESPFDDINMGDASYLLSTAWNPGNSPYDLQWHQYAFSSRADGGYRPQTIPPAANPMASRWPVIPQLFADELPIAFLRVGGVKSAQSTNQFVGNRTPTISDLGVIGSY